MAFGFAQPFQSHLAPLAARAAMLSAPQLALPQVRPQDFLPPRPTLPSAAPSAPAQGAPAQAAPSAPPATSVAPQAAADTEPGADGPDVDDLISMLFGGP